MDRKKRSSRTNDNNAVRVEIRLMFLQIGSIKTQAEQFHVHLAIEARWLAKEAIVSTLDSEALEQLSQGEIVHLPADFDKQNENWIPKLFFLNSCVEDVESTVRYSLKKDDENGEMYVREHRIVKGAFNVPFYLHQYPNDVQELHVSIGSSLGDDEIKLAPHPTIASGINREVFESQQEWHLYQHVETRTRKVRGYFAKTDKVNDLDKPGKEKERSVLTVACHVARRSGYFFWNGYCIVFLLTSIAFSSFAITADQTKDRLSVAYTLLLSQIAFRWTISVSHLLPPVSYLTTMDKYSVISMFALVLLAAWHAIIGSIMFTLYNSQPIVPNTYWLWVDRYVFFVLLFSYILMHLVFIISYFRGPYEYRRKMREKDAQYRKDNLDNVESMSDQSNRV